MKKLLTILLSVLMIVSFAGCSSKEKEPETKTGYVVGICQIATHIALDAATQGFKDVLTEAFGNDVTFLEGNAAGEPSTCNTICSGFVSENVDLILANATASLQAAASATNSIPVLGTSITEYGTALSISDFNGLVGTNVSGTSDLAPLDQQAAMFKELLPDAKTVGILYCSSEPNSIYQVKVVTAALEKLGYTVKAYPFADSSLLSAVCQSACDESDAIYIPTDNTCADNTELIDSIATAAKTPIIAGEEGICTGCGIATLSISYYELGRTTGEMAVKILKGEAKVEEMPIEYYPNPVKKYMASRCEAYNITVPADYTAIVLANN